MNTDNMVGRTVAGYHLAEYIGEGGTATVYRAEHPERGRAAVKILRPRLAQDPIAVKRFLREAEYGARVKHPNIVQTYDYGATDGLHYLALEWAQGEPLAEFINRSGKLAPPLVATIVEQLGAALGARPQGRHHPPRPQARQHHVRPGHADGQAAGLRHRARRGAEPGGAAHPGRVLRRNAPVRGPGDAERRAGERAGRRLQPGDDRLLPADPGAAVHRARAQGSCSSNYSRKPRFRSTRRSRGSGFPAPIEAAVMHGLERDLSKRSKTVDEFAAELCTAVRQGGGKRGFLASLFGKGGE